MNENIAGSAAGIDLARLEQLARYRDMGGFGITASPTGAYVKIADVIALARAAPQHPDLDKLCSNIDALLALDQAGSLVPHGIGGHARSLLTSALAALRAIPQPSADRAPEAFTPTDQQFKDWCERHALPPHHSRDAFDDAASLYLTASSADRAPADGAGELVNGMQCDKSGMLCGSTNCCAKASIAPTAGDSATPQHSVAEQAQWLPTAENVNALPGPVRRFVHDLATRCDPAGDTAALTGLRDQLDGVQIMYRKVMAALDEVRGCFNAAEVEGLTEVLANTADERLKDLVERRLMYALYAAQGPLARPLASTAATQPEQASEDDNK